MLCDDDSFSVPFFCGCLRPAYVIACAGWLCQSNCGLIVGFLTSSSPTPCLGSFSMAAEVSSHQPAEHLNKTSPNGYVRLTPAPCRPTDRPVPSSSSSSPPSAAAAPLQRWRWLCSRFCLSNFSSTLSHCAPAAAAAAGAKRKEAAAALFGTYCNCGGIDWLSLRTWRWSRH